MKPQLIILVLLVIMVLAPSALALNAVGVSDNGTAELWNGSIIHYSYHVNAVMGYLTLYNASFTIISLAASGNVASIQLNLVVTNGIEYFWVQNIAHIGEFNGSRYMVWFWDDLWNITRVNALLDLSLIKGNRTYPVTEHYAYYYRYVAPPVMLVKAPFTVSCMVTVNLTHGYINVNYWYRLNNTRLDTGWVKYDDVLIKVNSTRAYIIIGGFNPGNLSNDIEWVTAGYTAAAQLYVFKWNASMILMYRYNGSWFTPPGGQSRSFDTGESVNPIAGISESYINGIVHQEYGRVNSTYLWLINASVNLRRNELIIRVTPSGARWIAVINGKAMLLNSSETIINTGNWASGRYKLTLTLYAGDVGIYEYAYEFTIKGVGVWLWLIPLVIVLLIIAIYRGILKYGARALRRYV
ncbi:thermopsin family protease [Caldivirga maquilingensis]|uniref:Thermopsin n=1 Tax=Caldivirga maquilingensis (strain ATCC 700844 / DSM 13496 / JCM 10307 / IC-167) TaxID=397948 RepID=A8ME13_CALMQ|nr:thermopsin family protease [Caldivirga maquilingensis]ABW02019.1 hypothetical protein Cmaq_1192 [Caldivirga maquilingensis IC-167]